MSDADGRLTSPKGVRPSTPARRRLAQNQLGALGHHLPSHRARPGPRGRRAARPPARRHPRGPCSGPPVPCRCRPRRGRGCTRPSRAASWATAAHDARRFLWRADAGQTIAEIEQGSAQLCPGVLPGAHRRAPQEARLSRPATGDSASRLVSGSAGCRRSDFTRRPSISTTSRACFPAFTRSPGRGRRPSWPKT